MPIRGHIAILFTVVAFAAFARKAMAAPLPQPDFADAGACTNIVLNALSASGTLSFSLSFAPCASNNVEVAFGVDLDGNGVLSPDEWRMEAGWNRGVWLVRSAEGECVQQAAAPPGGEDVAFRWNLWLRGGRCPSRLVATVDASPIFAGISASPPGWLYEPEWNMACVMVRGMDVVGEHGAVKASVDGTVFLLR
ncbi:MAG: hypothetical protein IKL96_02535 [Kiritimatiellae bacterium]|nr:hypothetical protein [Kiritimatiellia bacterium]